MACIKMQQYTAITLNVHLEFPTVVAVIANLYSKIPVADDFLCNLSKIKQKKRFRSEKEKKKSKTINFISLISTKKIIMRSNY